MRALVVVLEWLGGQPANLALAAAHFGVAAYMAAKLDESPLLRRTLRYTPSDPAADTGVEVNLRALLIFFLIATGCFHLLYASLGVRAARLRFFEYAITATCMFVILQVLSGEDNADVVVACAALTASTMLFGFLQDRNTTAGNSQGGAAHWFGWAPFIAAWALLIKRFLNSVNRSSNVPNFVKKIVWVEFALFCCFAIVQYIYAVRLGGARARLHALEYAGAYNLLSVTAKLTLAFTVFFGIQAMESKPA